jgi:hypothetical protein
MTLKQTSQATEYQALANAISQLRKPSPPMRTNGKFQVLEPTEAGFVCVAPDF